MARVLEFDRKHFGRDNLITLTRGDDWSLETQITDEKGGYREMVIFADDDIVGATGYFKADQSNVDLVEAGTTRIPAIINIKDCSGEFLLELPASGSELVQKDENGVDLFLEVEKSSGRIETVYTYGQPIAIREQDFTTY